MTGPARRSAIQWVVIAIAALTVIAGLAQIALPRVALSAMGLAVDSPIVLQFRALSALTVLIGAALLVTMLRPGPEPGLVLLAALAKGVGPVMIAFGMLTGLMHGPGVFAGVYDAVAGIVVGAYWLGLSRSGLGPG